MRLSGTRALSGYRLIKRQLGNLVENLLLGQLWPAWTWAATSTGEHQVL
jgi:hypothetical protein